MAVTRYGEGVVWSEETMGSLSRSEIARRDQVRQAAQYARELAAYQAAAKRPAELETLDLEEGQADW